MSETRLTAGILKQDQNIQKVKNNADFYSTRHAHIFSGSTFLSLHANFS